jgi:cell cycle checkpoint protein
VSITSQYLQWTTESERARANHIIHKEAQDVEQFLFREDVSNKYKMSLMKSTIRGLTHATKVSIRTNREGFLSLQFHLKAEQNMNDNCFLDYYVVPEADVHSYQS